MAVYEYKALSTTGRQIKGLVTADTAKSARQKLKRDGIFPTSLEESDKTESSRSWNVSIDFKRNRKVSIAELAVATRQFSTLISAGMPIVESLRALADQIDNARLRRVIASVGDQVNEGATLANAMRDHQGVFPRLFVNMVASGEASGTLDLVLDRLADLYEAQAALRRKVMSALTYPVLMLVLCFGIVVLLLAYVVPQITSIFEEQGAVLPLPTRIVIAASDFSANYWWVLIGFAILIPYALRKYISTSKGKRLFDTVLLRLPMIGPLALKVASARFTRNLGTMLSSGVEMLNALAISRNIVGNVVLEDVIDSAANGVREGKGLANELKKADVFPMLLIHMTAIGEKTGDLEQMLIRAAQSFESEVDAFISGLTSILEPVLIIFLAGIVGLILGAVMLPMLEMTSLVGA